VKTPDSHPPFLFFKDDPGKTRYVTLWSGMAAIFEKQAMKQWALDNAPGIPKKLAACFAWFVTQTDRNQ
jgi:hypothetical protein